MEFRLAGMRDARFLFELRNDPLTREMSVNRAPVPWQEHVDWLTALLADPARDIFIAIENRRRVGHVRRETDGARAELSWVVAPHARGGGVGKRMLRLFVTLYPDQYVARIRSENSASVAICLAAGFGADEKSAEFADVQSFTYQGGTILQ